MSLQQWHEAGWVNKVERSPVAVSDLLHLAQREIGDASSGGISPDGCFGHAYNAVHALCQTALHASGFAVVKGGRGHERTMESLRFTLGDEWFDLADYFDQCRRMRHRLIYERSGVTQQQDADELLSAAKQLQTAVKNWLQDNHADLV
ncbi:MAG: hypothetical protein ACYTFA_14310 [Planctomycetota bacterium]|jgi:hypothetical protein